MSSNKMVNKTVKVVSTFETGHEDVIHDAQMDQCGLRLATCSSDCSVRIYDVKTKAFLAELRGHEGPVWQIAWAPSAFGSLLASCSYDQKVILWHESGEKWNKLYELKRHEASVNSVCWGPMETGLVLASGSSDGSISLLKRATSSPSGWDVSVISHAHSFGCNAVTWASFLAPKPCGTVRRLASGGNDNVVKIWSETAKGWTEEAKLELHTDWVRDVAWAPFSGLPVNVIASCSQDKTVVIWTEDCTGGECGTWTPVILPIFDDVLWHVSWSMVGNILAVSGGDNKVTLWKENAEGTWFEMSRTAKDSKREELKKQRANSASGGSSSKDSGSLESPPVPAL